MYLCIQHPQNFQHWTQPIGTQVPVQPTCLNQWAGTKVPGRPTCLKVRGYSIQCVRHNSSSSRTSNTSNQPIGTQVPVDPTSAELPTLDPTYRHTSTCAANLSEPMGRHRGTWAANLSEGKKV